MPKVQMEYEISIDVDESDYHQREKVYLCLSQNIYSLYLVVHKICWFPLTQQNSY